ncbi:MAG: hypothetical protein IH851_06020 [Armatimonadetes bacterium]|nr:hypothetical protein [Armatimonadota bacterium]
MWDALFALSVLVIATLSLAALMPTFSRSQHMSDEMSRAVQICSRQIEQLRLAGFDNLNHDALYSLGLADPWQGEGPMTFSRIPGEEAILFSVATSLRDGVGEMEIYDIGDGAREVIVRVEWTAASGKSRSEELTTVIGRD